MRYIHKIGIFLICLLAFCASVLAQSWQPLANKAPFRAGVPLLLTDGTLLVHDFGSSNWWKLKPDATGSYQNGTWTQAASLPPTYAPLYYSSAVLADGRVIIVGGEYNNFSAVWTNQAAVYDPQLDVWTMISAPAGWVNIGDAQSVVMPDGKFMIGNPFDTRMAILDPTTMTWTALNGTSKADRFDEEGFTLMPDGTILTLDAIQNPNTEKYIPWLDTWLSAGATPQTLVNAASQEMGPTVLLPNGKVVAFGATGHNAIYTVGASPTDTGSWASIPDFPIVGGQQLDIADGPACLLPNGNVLCGASPGIFLAGTKFFEYDGLLLNPEPATPNSPGNSSYVGNMLMLPSGQVFYTDFTSDIQIYTPIGAPNDAWRPTITDCPAVLSPLQQFTITGTQFNGLSQCSSYGDDSGNATNYPLVRITNFVTGHVQYCRTADHSTMAVATGSTPTSTTVTVPLDVEPGPSGVEVVTNGIASASVLVTIGSGTDMPIISGLAPSSTQANTGDLNLMVNGFQLKDGDTVTWIAAGVSTNLTTTFVSANQLTAVISASLTLDPGTAVVKIGRADGSLSNGVLFTITTDVPVLASISPNSIMASSPDLKVTLTGSRFRSDDTVNWTSGGVTTPLVSTFVSSTQTTVNVPASLLVNQGSATISITNVRGRTSGSQAFTITTDVPAISSVTPASINAFDPDTTISIDGLRFRSGDVVLWSVNGVSTPLASSFQSETLMTAVVPAGLLTNSTPPNITVIDKKGQLSNSFLLTITNPTAVMTSISPATVNFGSPTVTMTITGDMFMPGATVVWSVKGVKTLLSSTYVSKTVMTAVIPAAMLTTPIKSSITVNNPAPGGGGGLGLNFAVTGIVTLRSMTPNSTGINQAFTLTVKGTGFQPGANVQIGSTILPLNVSTDALATASVPGSAVSTLGTFNVKILNPDGGQSGSLPMTVVNSVPVINTVTPGVITSGGPTFTMVLDGSGFVTGSVARWNGTTLATTYVSPTQIRAVVPASLFPKKGSYTVDVQNPAPGGGTSKTVKVTAN
jgi:hypothetical protein